MITRNNVQTTMNHKRSVLTISGVNGAAGAFSGALIDGIFYGLDSYKTQKQYLSNSHLGKSSVSVILTESVFLFSIGKCTGSWQQRYRGFLPITFTGNAAKCAVFFPLYEFTKHILLDR